METFKIEIQEFLSRIIEVEAETKDEAITKVRQLYRNEEIVLDSDDYVSTEIGTFPKESIISFDTLSNGANFYLIEGENITFWGNDIVSKVVQITPQVFDLITINDIPLNEPCEFIEDIDYKIFTLLYYSK
ncbi:MAG: DpnD/PcfM family protein [Leptospiraceae bacterium]|nr:hypothetical protein [Leptospiraceae bacterium]MCK6381695.1 DpnD/PcfM family protein [Leptospiraceae bacterium]